MTGRPRNAWIFFGVPLRIHYNGVGMSNNSYLEEVIQQQQQVGQELRKRKVAPPQQAMHRQGLRAQAPTARAVPAAAATASTSGSPASGGFKR